MESCFFPPYFPIQGDQNHLGSLINLGVSLIFLFDYMLTVFKAILTGRKIINMIYKLRESLKVIVF